MPSGDLDPLQATTTNRPVAADKTLDELLAAERAAVHATAGTPDAAEGIMAFLEKRTPVFNRSPTD